MWKVFLKYNLKRKPLVSTVLFLVSIVGFFLYYAIVWAAVSAYPEEGSDINVFLVFLLGFAASSLVIYISDSAKHERIAITFQVFCTIIIHTLTISSCQFGLSFLICTILAEASIYEKWPLSGILSFIIVFGISGTVAGYKLLTDQEVLYTALAIKIVTGTVLSSVLIGMIYYREKLVEAQQDISRLRVALKQLTKTNLEYQDYAIDIEENATEQERNRITRDIHDIIGYTLTNTIMMMEAASDMMRRNPLGVASLINTARENAQEGLEETRRALYKLREKQIERPKGMVAVIRMIKVFSAATGVDVEILWNNVQWSFDDVRDFIIFHTIQQGLVNAFIHGKATEVIIQGYIKGSELVISLKDNGIGSGLESIQEGIGLKGLRERLERINGSYEVQNTVDGFLLIVIIPLSEEENEVQPGVGNEYIGWND